jgi:NOL1/NOP2/fmu family ribosome biogenesis protein
LKEETVQIIARHERDDRDIELEEDQIREVEAERDVSFAEMAARGAVLIAFDDGWGYRIGR